ncbi:hypothetical protein BGW37DRAFT_491316 [Umbelopsis sp. PMI_123]|nr:hypothetical protein BGW37DRAFT_491316 [Umbelopsis sp. PMI_123]
MSLLTSPSSKDSTTPPVQPLHEQTASSSSLLRYTSGDSTTVVPDYKSITPPQTMSPPPSSKRLLSLDALRGVAVLFMIIVNYQGYNPYPVLHHVPWFGFHLIADQVFPLFLFVAGVAIAFAYKNVSHQPKRSTAIKIVKRFVLLFGIGLLLNAFPFTDPEVLQTWRIPGVLQRAAICYIVTTVLYITCGTSQDNVWRRHYLYFIYPITIFILWISLTYAVYNPSCQTRGDLSVECCTETMFDSALFGSHSLGAFDPEGTISTLPSLLTSWSGLLIGMHLNRRKPELHTPLAQYKLIVHWLLLAAGLASVAGMFDSLIPIGKPLWTPTFMLLTSAVSIALFSIMFYLYDIQYLADTNQNVVYKALSYLLYLFLACGRNSTVLYILSELVLSLFWALSVPSGIPLYEAMQTIMFASWLPQGLDSLVLSLFWVVLMIFPVAIFMDNRGIYIKL